MDRGEFPEARAVIDFWLRAGPQAWFAKNNSFDTEFRLRFLDAHLAAARRGLVHWLDNADASLALVILLDQFPRNAFRDTPHMYGTDTLAMEYASQAVAAGHVHKVKPELAQFLCVPFMHSENISDQRRSVELCKEHSPESMPYAIDHHDIIARFGRFPHRNAILSRSSTPEELAFLADGGFAG